MPQPTKGARLGGSPAHQKAILSNLATSLFEHGAITTTEAKARRLRPFAEKLITKAKRGDLHNRRQVLSVVRDKGVVHVLFTEIGPRYADRPGGYTRITKIGPRKGDNAPMAVISLVEEQFTSQARATKRTTSAPAKKAAAPAEPVVDETRADAPVDGADEGSVEDAAAEGAAGTDVAVEGTAGTDVAVEGAAGTDAAVEDAAGTDAALEDGATTQAATEEAAAGDGAEGAEGEAAPKADGN